MVGLCYAMLCINNEGKGDLEPKPCISWMVSNTVSSSIW